jgi:hypothetical protein
MLAKWQIFEKMMAKLLEEDGAKTTKGSGSVKHEEDLIGETIVAQCKQTEKVSYSVSDKDISRLLSAADVLDRFPMFLTETAVHTTVSIPITKSTIDDISQIINMIIVKQRLRKLLSIKTDDPAVLHRVKKVFNKTTKLLNSIVSDLRDIEEKCVTKIKVYEDDALMYDLFDNQGV